jgi:hypothetical protein
MNSVLRIVNPTIGVRHYKCRTAKFETENELGKTLSKI